ncbi:MAG: efflux RND transporter periplasmic adaptor subunit [Victivallales bacterium]|nr:efflux RND transporter periplasmic adaptor subunit [Victivallales bacterium]
MKVKKLFVWLLLILIVGALATAIAYRAWQKSLEQAKSKPRGQIAIAIEAVMPKHIAIQDNRIFTGTLKSWSLFEVAPKVGGRLEAIRFDVGDKISDGDVIARIEDEEYKQSVDQAAADLEVAKAQMRQAEVMLDLRRREYERYKALDEKKATTQAMLESAETAFHAQEAAYNMQKAETKRREAILENAKLKLADCVISADWSNDDKPRFVGARYVDQGALLAPNQEILSVAELDPLRAVIYVIERDYPYVKTGQSALLTTDAYPGVEFQSKVVRIAQLFENGTRQAEIQLEIPNRELKLKPGMFVRVQLEFSSKDNAQVVPRNAIVKRDGQQGVFTVDLEKANAHFVPVETGISSGNQVEITSPAINSPVATLGNHLLTDEIPIIVPKQFTSKK